MHRPAGLQFVGPLPIRTSTVGARPAWWDRLDGPGPTVVVTQGTIANDDLDQLAGPTLEAYVPFDRLLAHAAVFVTNGGYAGVQQAPALGVPLVVAGDSEDKPAVAARVGATGVGLDGGTGRPTVGEQRSAIRSGPHRPDLLADRVVGPLLILGVWSQRAEAGRAPPEAPRFPTDREPGRPGVSKSSGATNRFVAAFVLALPPSPKGRHARRHR